MLKIFKMVLIIIGMNPEIIQKLTHTITNILDRTTRRILASIWGKITKNNPYTTTSPTHNTPKNPSPHYPHPLPETIHTFATDFETKPHFRKYIHTNTQKIFNIIYLIIHKILTPKFAITLGTLIILFICCSRILDFFLPLSTITI